MLKTHAVGIDLGTTYSCISHLNEHGEPVTLANQEGELTTPSVVMIEDGEAVVGTEALRNAVVRPERVIQNSKRFMGDSHQRWTIDGKAYTPVDVASLIIKKLLSCAAEQIGNVEQAVITVPAQFSELQRQATVEAGLRAGLKHVDIINEPVAAALCYVLGTEGLWFTELAEEQRILVYDLGGGTFDLSLVKYHKNEVRVIASSGDLHLGGIDWNQTLLDAIAGQFAREFKTDPRKDPQSLQFLTLETENTKRALSVRPKAALTVQHGGHRKTYQVEQSQFERLTQRLVERTCEITQQMLKDNKFGWAHVDVILTAGGSSRMPMVRNALKKIGGRTLNTSLSPDLSIAHGATYYAGMLLTNSEFAKSILNESATAKLAKIKQQSVSARGLGILVRDDKNVRVPHFLIPANTPLPTAFTQTFGTVVPNQKRVHLYIVESGTVADQQYVELGTCIIDNLPPNLPENSQVSVTISYDEQARVHVSAKDVTSGKSATTEIVREENRVKMDVADWQSDQLKRTEKSAPPQPTLKSSKATAPSQPMTFATAPPVSPPKTARPSQSVRALDESLETLDQTGLSRSTQSELEDAGLPVPLCNECGEPLDARGRCPLCATQRPQPVKAVGPKTAATTRPAGRPTVKPAPSMAQKSATLPAASAKPVPKKGPASAPQIPIDIEDIIELELAEERKPAKKPVSSAAVPAVKPKPVVQAKPVAKTAPAAQKPSVAGGTKPAGAKPQGPSVKSPPVPPALKDKAKKPGVRKGDLVEEGEQEFWKLEES